MANYSNLSRGGMDKVAEIARNEGCNYSSRYTSHMEVTGDSDACERVRRELRNCGIWSDDDRTIS